MSEQTSRRSQDQSTPQRNLSNSDFAAAVRLTESIYTYAVIHCVAELSDGVWHNLYTSATYGRYIDFTSIAEHVDHKTYDSGRVLCLRFKTSRTDAARLVSEAKAGKTSFESWEINYVFVEMLEGLRQASHATDLSDNSFWETSCWTQESIGSRKSFGQVSLTRSSAWRVAVYLECLQEARWAAIPLARFPEKLGDLDEIHPSPFSIEVGNDNGAASFRIESVDKALFEHDVLTTGTLIRDDLIVRALHISGPGPVRVEEDFGAMSLLTTVDGIPMDIQANWFLRSLSMKTTTYGKERLLIPAEGRRKELGFIIPRTQATPTFIGTRRTNVLRHQAWIAGRLLRTQSPSSDSEYFYNPVLDTSASERALRDLQKLGKDEGAPRIIVADPYVLDERAMHALAVMSLREHHIPVIHVLTQFQTGASQRALATSPGTNDQATTAETSARTVAEQNAKSVAQKIASQLNVTMIFYRIESLHDRFLMVGERLWHIGYSFNQIGQEISAVVEMRDERVKFAVTQLFDEAQAHPPVFEVRP
ncbi:MAG: hypothetical protein PW792_08615 [Acidobacteriaceae bacterium]|nr:hypothetical protein [Acidobacteriaceae bacterium]